MHRHATILVGAFLGAAFLTACGGGGNSFSSSTPLSVTPQVAAQESGARAASQRLDALFARHPLTAGEYKTLYSFKDSPDAAYPNAGLIDVGGKLYGTTEEGGSRCKPGGCGTVFSVSTTGTERVLHSFSGTDGSFPFASLIDVHGTLYGTTAYGGAYASASYPGGTVFEVSTSGKVRVLHSFGSGTDAAYPNACLIDVKGTLYGTTEFGGAYNLGTVFSVSTTGTEHVLHSFGNGTDGAEPFASLIDVKGTLYGTTSKGGTHGKCAGNCGTVFEVTSSGTERVLHSFGSGTDGTVPVAGLIDVKGTLYGTTEEGGSRCKSEGCGTVFSVSTTGTERVLHSFSGKDGEYPLAGLINVNGTLYGTTPQGGTGEGDDSGTIFSVSTTGTERVLHNLGSPSGSWTSDGADPHASLINVSGTLYGTTVFGGANDSGTIFALRP